MLSGLDIFYKYGAHTMAQTINAVVVPRTGDFVVMNNLKHVIKEVIWHLNNGPSWIEIQVEKV